MHIFDRIKFSIVQIDYWIRNSILELFTHLLFNTDNLKSVEKVLIFRTGSMGDSICALPAINIIRKNLPQAQIDILTNAGAHNLVSIKHLISQKLINNVIDYLDIPKAMLTQLIKNNKYDLFIELPQDQQTIIRQLRNIIWVKMLGIKKAFGWEVAATRLFPVVQDKYKHFESERERLVNILKRKHFNISEYEYPLNIDDEIILKIKKLLDDNNIKEKAKNVALIIGAKRPQNRWPLEYFKGVADYLSNEDLNIILIGDKADFELSKTINNKNVYNFCGQLEALESAELLRNCSLTISNDTGPMHLSYAVGTSVIAIFSRRDYSNKWYPPIGNNKVFRTDKMCYKCFDICTEDNACMKRITSDMLIDFLRSNRL